MAAKRVIDAAWQHGTAYDLSSQAAFALESAGLLQSPETAAENARLRERLARYRTAWQRARTRARSTGGAADRYAARAVELQTALQDTLDALLAGQMERDALRARVAELEAAAGDGATRTVDEDPIAYALTDKAPLPADLTHMCGIPLTRRLDCGHCPHEVCQDCDRCPCSCCCSARAAGLHHDYRLPHDMPQVAAEMLADRYPSKGAS
jgi:hypothetical protein